MACNNALMIRYRVKANPGCNVNANVTPLIPAGPITNITRVTGISLGEEGEIEVPEWDRKSRISDGKRNLPVLGLQFRIDGNQNTFNFFATYYRYRHDTYMTFLVDITRRDWQILHTYEFVDCEMRSFVQEDQELSATKLGLVDMAFSPYDVLLKDSVGNYLVPAQAITP